MFQTASGLMSYDQIHLYFEVQFILSTRKDGVFKNEVLELDRCSNVIKDLSKYNGNIKTAVNDAVCAKKQNELELQGKYDDKLDFSILRINIRPCNHNLLKPGESCILNENTYKRYIPMILGVVQPKVNTNNYKDPFEFTERAVYSKVL